MKAPRTIKFTAYLFGFVGAALLTGLMISQGAADVIRAVASIGWGLVAISGLHIAKLLSDTIGWLMVIPKRDRLRLHTGLWIHWLGESVSDLLPTARLGADIVTARLAAAEGMALISAVASMLVDVTACVFTKIIYTVVGLVLLVTVTGQTSLVGPAATGILIGILAIAGFYSIQRLGVFGWGAAIASRLAHSSSWQLFKQNGEAALALSLIRRVRELILGIPGLVAWQLIGGGRLWQTHSFPVDQDSHRFTHVPTRTCR